MNNNRFFSNKDNSSDNNIENQNNDSLIDSLDFEPTTTENDSDSFKAMGNINNFENFEDSYNNNEYLNSNIYNENYQINSNMDFENNNFDSINQLENVNNEQENDETLLRAFIRYEYEKLTTRKFNFAYFFLSIEYMAYRKMWPYIFPYIIIIYISNFFMLMYKMPTQVIGLILVALLITSGFFINRLYIYHSKKKVNKIKNKYQNVDFDKLVKICEKKGGTNIWHLILSWIVVPAVLTITAFLLNYGIEKIYYNKIKNAEPKVKENVILSTVKKTDDGYEIIFKNENEEEGYLIEYEKVGYSDLNRMTEYAEYIKLDIYYIKFFNNKVIVDYKMYTKDTNEDITNIEDTDELEEKLHLKDEKNYKTEIFTVISASEEKTGYIYGMPYSYKTYTLMDSNLNKYKMDYYSEKKPLISGKKYEIYYSETKNYYKGTTYKIISTELLESNILY